MKPFHLKRINILEPFNKAFIIPVLDEEYVPLIDK
jgi:hypothetical protein